jgi:hypothetical protein
MQACSGWQSVAFFTKQIWEGCDGPGVFREWYLQFENERTRIFPAAETLC